MTPDRTTGASRLASRRLRTFRLLVLPFVVVTACSSPTGPEFVQPRLSHLDVWAFNAPSGLMVRVQGTAEDPIQGGQALLATMSAGDGAPVEVELSRLYCGDSSTEMWVCRSLLVILAPGTDLSDLHAFLADIDAAFIDAYTLGGRPAASVHVFSGSVPRAMNRISTHPAVEMVELETTGTPGGTPGNGLAPWVALTVPTLATDPTPRSAQLSVSEGEELVVRYRQPDGSELLATTTVETVEPVGGGR